MATDALALCIGRSSATMVLTMQGGLVNTTVADALAPFIAKASAAILEGLQ